MQENAMKLLLDIFRLMNSKEVNWCFTPSQTDEQTKQKQNKTALTTTSWEQ